MTPGTRERILEVAARLFHEQGFAATGISTILREADVNSGSLYYFFRSKDELLLGVLERYVEILHPVVMAPIEHAHARPGERVFALLEQYRGWLRSSGCRMGCPIGNLALEVADNQAEVRELLDRNFRNWAKAVAGWLAQAELPAGISAGDLAHFVLTVMEGGIMQARARASLEPYDASVAQLRDYFARLGLVSAAKPKPRGAPASKPGRKRHGAARALRRRTGGEAPEAPRKPTRRKR